MRKGPDTLRLHHHQPGANELPTEPKERKRRASEASEALERAEAVVRSELGATFIGEPTGHLEGARADVDVPEVVRGVSAECVLCGNLTIWRSARNAAPVHHPCMVAYARGER